MKIPLVLVDYGKLICDTRKKKHMTHHELANLICSVSYLKKVENGRVEAENDIVSKLLQKLGIAIKILDEKYLNIFIFYKQWYEFMLQKNFNLVIEYNKLSKQNNDIIETPSNELKQFIELIKLRYLIFVKELDKVESQIDLLSKYKTISQQNLNYFSYFQGIVYLSKMDWGKGSSFLKKAESGFLDAVGTIPPELSYHIALLESNQYNTGLAIFYANSAKVHFHKVKNHSRTLDSLLIIGINETRLKLFDNAKQTFKNIISTSKTINDNSRLGISYHNLGYLESKQKYHSKAITYYRKSLTYKAVNKNSYLHTSLYLAKEYTKVDNNSQALEILKQIINLYESYALSENYYYLALMLRYRIEENSEELLKLLKDSAIPYFKEKEDKKNLAECYRLTAELYETKRKYKLSVSFYKELINLYNEV